MVSAELAAAALECLAVLTVINGLALGPRWWISAGSAVAAGVVWMTGGGWGPGAGSLVLAVAIWAGPRLGKWRR